MNYPFIGAIASFIIAAIFIAGKNNEFAILFTSAGWTCVGIMIGILLCTNKSEN